MGYLFFFDSLEEDWVWHADEDVVRRDILVVSYTSVNLLRLGGNERPDHLCGQRRACGDSRDKA